MGAPRRFIAPLVATLLCLGAPVPARAEPVPNPAGSHVKYYVVQGTDGGAAESLWDISTRLLGSGDRYLSIVALNQGRTQPDGGTLTDPTVLRVGWLLVLPWDAYGDGVLHGLLPTRVPAPPTPPPSRADGRSSGDGCGSAATTSDMAVPWAQLRLAPSVAWQRSTGNGVTVAVVDSGVDATVPALAGRVRPGADVDVVDGRGDTDCLGRGTALAGIVAAQARPGSHFAGMAPGAVILPVRIPLRDGRATGEDVVRAVGLAVDAGADVVMVPAEVTLTEAHRAALLGFSADADVVLVVAAPPAGSALGDGPYDGLLRVGAVGTDDEPAYPYPKRAVDVLAPGVAVASVGLGGTGEIEASGTDFAVPFVAGLVALVRSAHPDLNAAAVVDRVVDGAEMGQERAPDPRYGWGVIDPAATVGAAAQAGTTGGRTGTFTVDRGPGLAVVVVVLLGMVGLLVVGVRQGRRRE
ncbi:S8 family serine peptidase [Micromonospora sp. NPDC049903]|uniref:S8 family serine peptidase n=1 Tax=Micromonospora sp. NPDC049903 TaxID=3364276 RepID=UPI00379EB0F3